MNIFRYTGVVVLILFFIGSAVVAIPFTIISLLCLVGIFHLTEDL